MAKRPVSLNLLYFFDNLKSVENVLLLQHYDNNMLIKFVSKCFILGIPKYARHYNYSNVTKLKYPTHPFNNNNAVNTKFFSQLSHWSFGPVPNAKYFLLF